MHSIPDFPAFFRALWGRVPFPWQARLANAAVSGAWPAWITLPTGMGKTAVLDIAVYALACQAARPLAERTAPVRIVFAVNRRIVVDDAFERARHIAEALQRSLADADAPLHGVAHALQALAGEPGAKPLEAYPLRGATFTDRSWARTPTQPLILSTTLDQLGSRLLFRGYGVSEFARPIHAALLAHDALLILDEAHAARAFSQTLQGVASFRQRHSGEIRTPFHTVQLTATPPADATDTFTLNADDEQDPTIRRRRTASKPAELIPVEGATRTERHKKLASKMAAKATQLLSEGHRRVLLVVNRVATAEALLTELKPARGKPEHDAAVHILTGRIRPLDRDALIESLTITHQLKSTEPSPSVPKLLLISTQCIEVGADFDFDALLSELAPLDNLRQRFGRLNRYGRHIPAPGAVFAPEESLAANAFDPIYGETLTKVWQWLGQQPNLDFGLAPSATRLPQGEALTPMLAPAADAPVLLAPHLDLLCQTSPEPHLSPEPSLYIHGPGRDFPEVSVVLRDDLDDADDPIDFLTSVPPLGTEAAAVPLHLARRWLASPDKAKDDSGDAPHELDSGNPLQATLAQPACLWRDGQPFPCLQASDLRPGDTLVLSARLPFEELVRMIPIPAGAELDQYERAHLLSRDRLSIRFHASARASLRSALPEGEVRERFDALTRPLFEPNEDEGRWFFNEQEWKAAMPEIAAHLARHLASSHPAKPVWSFAAYLHGDCSQPRPPSDWTILPFPDRKLLGALLTNRSRVGATPWPLEPADLGRQGNSATVSCSLKAHSAGVSARASRYAAALPDPIAKCLRHAGLWHDLGKLDPRFQALLHGCALYLTEGREKLAKSSRLDPAREKALRVSSGLPGGFRHELLSALILSHDANLSSWAERDLLLHLVASHHGRCRAFAPVVPDPSPEPFEVSLEGQPSVFPGADAPLAHLSEGVTRRFWTLTRRFGWWGLAYLETVLRLADQLESAKPTNP